jgi:hypothetical protein
MRLQRAETHPTFAALSVAEIERAKKLADIPSPEPA